jgi:hypothetical protein
MKPLRQIVTESILDLKPGSQDHFDHHAQGFIKHSRHAQAMSDSVAAHSPGGHDLTGSEPSNHSRMAANHLKQLYDHHPKKKVDSFVQSQYSRHSDE